MTTTRGGVLPQTVGLIHETPNRGLFKTKCRNPDCNCSGNKQTKRKRSLLCRLGSHDMHINSALTDGGITYYYCHRKFCDYKERRSKYAR